MQQWRPGEESQAPEVDTFRILELALYQSLGKLPEPELRDPDHRQAISEWIKS
jgi:hypothetical protein